MIAVSSAGRRILGMLQAPLAQPQLLEAEKRWEKVCGSCGDVGTYLLVLEKMADKEGNVPRAWKDGILAPT